MINYEVGTHYIKKQFDCLECAKRYYMKLNELKYIMDLSANMILENTYGWKEE